MLALFQNKVGYKLSLMGKLQLVLHVNHCLPHERYLKAAIAKHSTRVKAKHMTHKASPTK